MTFCPRRIVCTIGSVNSGFCSRLVLSTLESGQQGVCWLGIYQIGSLVTSISSHIGFRPIRVLSTLDSALVCFFLLGCPSTRDIIYFDTVHSEVCPHDELLTKDCVHHWFCQFWILLTWGSVFLGVFPTRCLSTWILSTWKPVHMIFRQLRIVSTIGCVHSGFCSLSWFYLIGNMPIQDFSNWDPVHFALCSVGSLSTSTRSILESGYMKFCPCRIVPTIDFVNSGFCSRFVLSTWESVHLGIYLPGFSPLGSLATWHVAHVGLCPLLVRSTLDSA